jgi:putative DNA primase/helicase
MMPRQRKQASTKPVALEIAEGGIPREVKALNSWVGWRYERRDDKWMKPPVSPRTGLQIDVTDPASWTTFKEAIAAYRRRRDIEGIGFAFADDDPYSGIDLDDCRDHQTGELKPWAKAIVKDLNSYTEVSPSGKGVKIIVRGKLPPGSDTRKGHIEVYSRSRYFTITGHHLPGTPRPIEDRQEALQVLYNRLFGEDRAKDQAPGRGTSEGLTDDEIVARAMEARNGEKFARLWAGDTTGYTSNSEADLALCGMLAFYAGPDPERVERLFNRSGLAERKKWKTRKDYRMRTVRKAINGQGETHRSQQTTTVLTRGTKSIQENTRSIQENPREVNTVTPSGVEGEMMKGGRGLDGEQQRRSEAKTRGEGQGEVGMAIELADSCGDAPDWEASFSLARRLRTLSEDNPEQFEEAVRAFCLRSERPFEEFWYAFLDCWEKVRTAEGEDVLAWAAKEAKKSPYTPTPCPGLLYATTASIAFHLSRHTNPEPFLLPVERLAALLEVKYAMTISRIINLLEKDGVIKCVDDNYNYVKGKAKEYIFTGGQPNGE